MIQVPNGTGKETTARIYLSLKKTSIYDFRFSVGIFCLKTL